MAISGESLGFVGQSTISPCAPQIADLGDDEIIGADWVASLTKWIEEGDSAIRLAIAADIGMARLGKGLQWADVLRDEVVAMLSRGITDERAAQVADILAGQRVPHDFSLTAERLNEMLGWPMADTLPAEIEELVDDLYMLLAGYDFGLLEPDCGVEAIYLATSGEVLVKSVDGAER